jgi:hypothetical protein
VSEVAIVLAADVAERALTSLLRAGIDVRPV